MEAIGSGAARRGVALAAAAAAAPAFVSHPHLILCITSLASLASALLQLCRCLPRLPRLPRLVCLPARPPAAHVVRHANCSHPSHRAHSLRVHVACRHNPRSTISRPSSELGGRVSPFSGRRTTRRGAIVVADTRWGGHKCGFDGCVGRRTFLPTTYIR